MPRAIIRGGARLVLLCLLALAAAGCGHKVAAPPPVCSLLHPAEVASAFAAKAVHPMALRETAGPACLWLSKAPPRGFEITYETRKGATPTELYGEIGFYLKPLTCVKLRAGWDLSGGYIVEPHLLFRATDFGDSTKVKADLCRLLPTALARFAGLKTSSAS